MPGSRLRLSLRRDSTRILDGDALLRFVVLLFLDSVCGHLSTEFWQGSMGLFYVFTGLHGAFFSDSNVWHVLRGVLKRPLLTVFGA